MAACEASSSPSPGRAFKSHLLLQLLLLLLAFAVFFSGADARGHHLYRHNRQASSSKPIWPPEWTQYKVFPRLANFNFASRSGIIHDGNECFDCCVPACEKRFPKSYIDECPFFCVRVCTNLFDN